MVSPKSLYLATPVAFNLPRDGGQMINLRTKFEVFSFTRYEDMKCAAKCTKCGGCLLYTSDAADE